MKRYLTVVVLSWAIGGCATAPVVAAATGDAEPAILEEFKPAYPEEALAKGAAGTVFLKVLLDASGKVTEARVLEGPDFGLHQAALDAIRRFRFRPALKNGEPVPYTFVYRFTFRR